MTAHYLPMLSAVYNNIMPIVYQVLIIGLGFGLVDPDRKEHNAEVLECTKRLLETVIPNFADKVKTFELNSLPKLKALLHSEGMITSLRGCGS